MHQIPTVIISKEEMILETGNGDKEFLLSILQFFVYYFFGLESILHFQVKINLLTKRTEQRR